MAEIRTQLDLRVGPYRPHTKFSRLIRDKIQTLQGSETQREVKLPAAAETGARSALEATHGQMDGFFSQFPYKCYLEEVASVEN